MANLKVLKTTGTDEEVLNKLEYSPIRLFVTALESSKTLEEHDLGDILFNVDDVNKFALLIKEDDNDKVNVAVLRVSVIRLIKHFLESEMDFSTIVLNRHQFKSEKEITTFIATVQEFLITYFGEVIEDDITLIITNYDESRGADISDILDNM